MSATEQSLALPDTPHLPGCTPRPPEETFAIYLDGLEDTLSPRDLTSTPAFKAGLEAFSRRYYWEAHELWEAVWIRLPPNSAERLLLRGLIQLANAGLKRRMGRTSAASRILALADEALTDATRRAPAVAAALGPMRAQASREEKMQYNA
ncbi:MAG: DUF309 domain-containing protein [Neomegalonema sp.]|nr:DUF309 domain-containing protein [Neomegalonema sp.]